jgi:signal peptidase II
LWVSVIIVFCDQLAKLAVLKTMVRSRSVPILGDWLKLTYTENPGMAFGVEFGPPAMISVLSIVATFVIIGYFYSVRGGYRPYRLSLALVLGGAIGNIVDRVLYGKVFYDLPYFQGRVVDYFHLDIWRGFLPDWIPLFGGKAVALFPIGNIADIAIIAGVVGIIWFQKRFHDQETTPRGDAMQTATPGDATEKGADHLPLGQSDAAADGNMAGDTDGAAVSPKLP